MAIKKLRWAVVGLGDISQQAVLPAFTNCRNAELVALVSGDPKKLKVLGDKYEVAPRYSYDRFEDCLRSETIDCVYIALPNDQHETFTVRAAREKVNVLCEKPMAVTREECERMIRACDENRVRLMIAYRLHFEEGNLTAMDLIQNKKLGEVQFFQSAHAMPVQERNIRTRPVSRGGGPTYDMGIYDINAARYLFQDDPISVHAQANRGKRPGMENIEETVSLTFRFPKERFASIIYSYGTADVDFFRVAGTHGQLSLEPAYTYVGGRTLKLGVAGEKPRTIEIPAKDQFAAEIEYFSDRVTNGGDIEPSGQEGLNDITIIEAVHRSIVSGETVPLHLVAPALRPSISQKIDRPPVEKQEDVNAASPSKDKAA